MIKIKAYYQKKEDLQKIEEPYKSMMNVFDRFYLKPPKGSGNYATQRFLNTLAISCIRTIAEDLTENQYFFVNQMKDLWVRLLNQKQVFNNVFDAYAVPYQFYLGIIFGGVYYVLTKQGEINDEKLRMMDEFVSGNADALPFFNVYKEELKNAEPQPSDLGNQEENKKKIGELRQQLNNANDEIVSLKKQLQDANDKIKIFETIPEPITANQKVRIELACILFDKAGIDQSVINRYGKKVVASTLMALLLDISENICRVYFSNRDYNNSHNKDDINRINDLLQKLEVDIQL
ncbi:MAG: hypothetical protein K5683_00620 [Prevotella sp.]|nr:hypothetical protein [Prevotella sp.]